MMMVYLGRVPSAAVLLASALLLLARSDAQAAPVYSLSHNADGYGNTGPNESVGPQGTPINYEFPYQVTYFTGVNFGEVYADVTPGSIGVFAHTYNTGIYAPQRQEVSARFAFDVIFSSPGSDPVDVAMNLDLSGMIQEPQFGYSTIQVRAGRTTDYSSGEYQEIGDPASPSPNRSGMLASFTADGSDQMISTNVMHNVPVNVPVEMFVQFDTIQPYTPENPTISFGNTLSLATSGDVFTISGPGADMVTANSDDAGIVDNRYVVPEPGTLLLAIIGLLAPTCCPQRRAG